MQKYEEDRFIITINNEQKAFYKMITFDSNLTNKKYIIYTDEDNNIFSSILINEDVNNIKLEKIVNEEDKHEVEKALLQAKISIDCKF